MAIGQRQQLYQAIRRLRDDLGADRCTLYLVDAARSAVYSKVALGLEVPEIQRSTGQGLVGYVARTGGALNTPEAADDPRFDSSVDRQTGYRTRSVLTMPVRSNGDVVGVLQALNKQHGGVFGTADEAIMLEGCHDVANLLESLGSIGLDGPTPQTPAIPTEAVAGPTFQPTPRRPRIWPWR